MKKVTLFLMGFILCLGYMNAQPVQPEYSTDDTGPWYYIQVKGDGSRVGLVWTAEGESIFGRTNAPATVDELNARLWRIEEDDNGELIFINKLEGKKLTAGTTTDSYGEIGAAVLADTPNTTWSISEITSGVGAGGFKISANNEELEWKNIHQADNYASRGFVVMMLNGYDNAANTSYNFVEYVDKGLVVTSNPNPANFNYVMINETTEDVNYSIIEVSAMTLSASGEEVQYAVTDENGNPVSREIIDFDETNWNSNTGGTLDCYFYPAEVKEYKFTLTVTCGDKTEVIEMTGNGAPKLPIELDTWYRIQYNIRTQFFLTDKGAGQEVDASIYEKDNDGQLWKFTATGEDQKYTLVNKLGRGLKYRYEEKEENVVIVTGRYLADNGANDNTYSFDLRNKDGNWQILWNEFEGTDDDGNPTFGTHINKINGGVGFTAYKYNPDDGNSVVFIKGDETISVGLPEFSTASNPTWYYIQFYRTANKEGKENVRFQSVEVGQKILQTEFDENNEESFQWRFEGTWDNFKIINSFGEAFGAIVEDNLTLVEEGDAASYSFGIFKDTEDWEAKELSSGRYLNDAGGNGTEVAGWSGGDPGARLVFIKVGGGDSGITTPGQTEGGEPAATVYYTIQGVQLKETPTTTGLYIRKSIYDSGEIKVETVLIKE